MKENENKIIESFYQFIGENHVNHVAEEFNPGFPNTHNDETGIIC